MSIDYIPSWELTYPISPFKKALKKVYVFSFFPVWWNMLGFRVYNTYTSRFFLMGLLDVPFFEISPVGCNERNWLVVSTHLKNISQNGNLPLVGLKIKTS